MLKVALFLSVVMIALPDTSNAQTIQTTVWKSYFAGPINDTATLAIGNDSMTVSNSHGMTIIKSTVHISNDTITINDVEGAMKCSNDDNGVYSYKISADKLILHLITDPCDGRADAIGDREWMRVNKQ